MRTPELPLISDYPAHYAAERPDADALVVEEVEAQTLNWQQFEHAIDRCTRALAACGVERGDRVAMLSAPRPEYLMVYMATARIGAIWQGLNPRQTYPELAYLVGDSQPKVLLGIEAFEGRDFTGDLKRLQQETDGIRSLHLVGERGLADFLTLGAEIDEEQLAQARAVVRSDDPCLVVYTSGSTGRPKGALLTHRNIVTTTRIQCEHWWAEPFRILNNMPISHIGGAVQLACHGIVAGGANVPMARFQPGKIVLAGREHNITVIHQVPMMYQQILDSAEFRQYGLPSVQALIWSGSPSPIELIRRFREITPNLFTSYGCTELGGEALYMPAGAADDALSCFVGLPPAGFELRLERETKEIQARSATIMQGYMNKPEATAETFTEDGWLKTGDCAEIDPDTGYWRIVGRIKEMYKSGGYNIYPREIELVLEEHPAVAMAAVFGVPDPVYTEKGVAYILLEAAASLSEEEIQAHCRKQLANYKVPKHFFIRDELPMLPIGKIDKTALKNSGIG